MAEWLNKGLMALWSPYLVLVVRRLNQRDEADALLAVVETVRVQVVLAQLVVSGVRHLTGLVRLQTSSPQ